MKGLAPLWAFALLVPTVAFATTAPAQPGPTTAAELRQSLTALLTEHHIPGASYAVFDRQGIVLSGVIGLADSDTRAPVTDGTLFRLGSVTKTVTAIAILQLIEQGHFGLQTPVSELLPDAPIRNPFGDSDPVRLIHLLTHTAGFDDMHAKAFFSPVERRGRHLESSLQHPEPLTVRWRPGMYESYSNPGYVLLGAILEAHYQQPWDEVVSARVLGPLGITQVAALASQAAQRDHASGHSGADMHRTPVFFEQTQADGALWCTAEDLARLGRFVLTDGASAPGVLRPETVRAMKQTRSTVGARAGLAYGAGLGLHHRIVRGSLWQGHAGGVLGAKASMHFHAEQGMGYVLLVNSENGLRKLEEVLADFISHQTRWKPPTPSLQPLTGDVDGWYRLVNPRISLLNLPTYLLSVGRAKAQADTLIIEPILPGFGYQATLKHHGNGLLADVDYGEVINGVVVRDGDGAAVGLETGGDFLQRTSMAAAVLPLASVLLSLALLLSAPFGRRTSLRNRWVRRLPGLALLAGVLGGVCAAKLELTVLAHANWQTVGVWAASVLFPALGVAGLVLSVRTWRQEPATVARWRCLLGSASVVCLSTWLATFGLFSFALWRW
ncbi:class A beta-lactamase-related serine hydrolase [Corallococcus sp. CA053C]|uniref:serine hydrolase domain-containing protein n=1 Tax=Corallococcus sp. CA053C TaxID=2316732 RepID=UPI000EA076BD|nr:serine hydrolase domain-containing protein [Corallococcus sp. CA053C]RKH14577.1 class A beta-lactamase-related serine hydrolase [Corallococcus sp. CA053C]